MQPTIVAGDTLNYATRIATYEPEGGWVLKLRLVPRFPSGTAISLVGTAEAGQWVVQTHAPVTATWQPGEYNWAAWVEKGVEKYTVETGILTVLPDPRTASVGTDTRSATERAFDAVEAMLHGRATDGVQSYTINGRQLSRYSMADLLKLRDRLRVDLARERRAAGLQDAVGTTRRIFVRIP
jgi:hypothetical protein